MKRKDARYMTRQPDTAAMALFAIIAILIGSLALSHCMRPAQEPGEIIEAYP